MGMFVSGSASSTGSFGSVHTVGNVGIGTKIPSSSLDVRGTIKAGTINISTQTVGDQLVTTWSNHGSYPYDPFTIDVTDPNFIDFDELENDGSLSYSNSNNILTPGKFYRIVVSNFSGTGNPQYFTTQTNGGAANTYNISNADGDSNVANGTFYFQAGVADVRVAIFGSAAVSTNTFRMTIFEVTSPPNLTIRSDIDIHESEIGNGSTVVAVDGTQGRLFSVIDEMSGSIFSANTIAGLPVIEAFSNNQVNLGPVRSMYKT